jgi:hypothetical protein
MEQQVWTFGYIRLCRSGWGWRPLCCLRTLVELSVVGSGLRPRPCGGRRRDHESRLREAGAGFPPVHGMMLAV